MWVYADVAQLVERELPKLEVAGSKPVVRFARGFAATRPFRPATHAENGDHPGRLNVLAMSL